MKGLDIILLGNCVENISFGEEIIVRGSIQRITAKGRTFSCLFLGLDALKDVIPNPVEFVNKRESIELNSDDVKQMQDFARKHQCMGKLLEELCKYFSPSTIGSEYNHIKKSILMAVANSDKIDRAGKHRIHLLIIGDTGLRKTG